jgi:hypothetical protein
MRKRTEPTIVEKALDTVNGFNAVYRRLKQQVAL